MRHHIRNRTALSVVVLCSALFAAPLAHAGTYTVYGCQTASGALAPMDGWNDNLDGLSSNPLEYWQDQCPGAVFMYMTSNRTHPYGAFATETFTAPAGTTIKAYALWRAVRLVPSAGYYYQTRQQAGGAWTTVDGCPGVGSCGTYGNYKVATASANHLAINQAPNDTTQVQLGLYCGYSKGCAAVLPNADSIWLFHTDVTLQTDSAPQFASNTPSGPLVSGRKLSGIVPVTIGATDQGGGIYQAELEITGAGVTGTLVQTQAPLDNSTGTCQPPWTVVVPCPLSANGTIDFNTDQLKDGTYTLRVAITDVAGNTTVSPPVTITTVNNPCSPAPAAAGMKIKAAFKERRGARGRFASQLTVGYRQHPTIYGRLTGPSGAPVANASVCVADQGSYTGAPLRKVTTLQTNANGRFHYKLGNGPSRTIYFVDRVPGGAIAKSVAVNVHVPVKVHVNAHHLQNGQVMTWTGKLPGPVPKGLTAVMQVWRGTYWETFQQISVASSGSWIGRYRFHFTTGVQRYVFRLYVRRQSQYPYASGISKKIHILVSG